MTIDPKDDKTMEIVLAAILGFGLGYALASLLVTLRYM